jgi:hypothetical protein
MSFWNRNGLYIYETGTKYWFENDQLSRRNGPATVYKGGTKYWRYEGQVFHCTTQEEFERLIKLRLFL